MADLEINPSRAIPSNTSPSEITHPISEEAKNQVLLNRRETIKYIYQTSTGLASLGAAVTIFGLHRSYVAKEDLKYINRTEITEDKEATLTDLQSQIDNGDSIRNGGALMMGTATIIAATGKIIDNHPQGFNRLQEYDFFPDLRPDALTPDSI